MARAATVTKGKEESAGERAYRLAKRRVQRAIRDSLTTLNFDGLELASLPSELAEARSLRAIRISSTSIENVSVLGKLRGLESVEISFSPVQDISALTQCTKLTYLRLMRTNVSDLSALANLTHLVPPGTSGRYFRKGISIAESPVNSIHPFATFLLLPQPYHTVETINHLRSLQGLDKIFPDGYETPEGLRVDLAARAASNSDALSAALRLPSPFDFHISSSGKIDVAPSAASKPVFPGARDRSKHRDRLEVCRELTQDLIGELEANIYQVRAEYLVQLRKYRARLPLEEGTGNILLADAAARSLRSMFASDSVFLSPAFAAQLKTLLEHHIGLRVFYPDVAEFYRDVQAGRIIEALPIDAVDGLFAGVEEHTPTVFSPNVAPSLKETSEPVNTFAIALDLPERSEMEQLVPPKDPLGELDPQKARDFSIAAWTGRLWSVLKDGENIGKRIEGWKKAYDTIEPFVHTILKWFFNSSPPTLPPTT